MRHIIKTLSLERLTSRLPSTWPAYLDGKVLFFDDDSLAAREYSYTSNYGLVPLAVYLKDGECVPSNYDCPEIDSGGTPIGADGPDIDYGECITFNYDCPMLDYAKSVSMSFEEFSKEYHFAMAYNHMVKHGGYCHREYDSAVQFFDIESISGKSGALPYGSDRSVYEDMDEHYERIGGANFLNWASTYVVPTFMIDDKFIDAWNTTHLYYPDVIKWMGWFEQRAEYSGYSGNCSASTNCCECERYHALGGLETYRQMRDWYNAVQDNLARIKSEYEGDYKPIEGSIDFSINMQNNIENIGYFSILSEEYVTGVDYDRKNVVVRDGESLVHISGESPYSFDETFMEMKFNDDAWASYTDAYVQGKSSEFYVLDNSSHYAFMPDGRKILGFSDDDVKSKCYTLYPSKDARWAMNEAGQIFDVKDSEIGIYKGDSDRKLLVMRERGTQTPYVNIGSKKIYATLTKDSGGNLKYYFPFIYESNGPGVGDPCEVNGIFNLSGNMCTEYPVSFTGGTEYFMSGGSIITSADTVWNDVKFIDRYAIADDVTYYHIKNGGDHGYKFGYSQDSTAEVPTYTFLQEDENATFIDGKLKLMYIPEQIYEIGKLTGHTSSKLKPLRVNKTLSDDIGQMIDGIFTVSTASGHETQHHPSQGDVLEPIYQVGNTANIREFSLTEKSGFTVGDIIIEMEFYHKDGAGNDIDESRVKALPFMYNNSGVSSGGCISAITSATMLARESYSYVDSGSIWCDVTYLVGCTLSGGSVAEGYNSGVTYKETVQFVKENAHYGLRKKIGGQIPMTENEVSAKTVSYPIQVYRMKQNVQEMVSDTYGSTYEDVLAEFCMDIQYYMAGGSLYGYTEDMEKMNGMQVYPTVMEEQFLGAAVPKNVSSDIYIDRGINTALDRHLKLGEVVSLEALGNYANGSFKIADS